MIRIESHLYTPYAWAFELGELKGWKYVLYIRPAYMYPKDSTYELFYLVL